MYKNQHFLLGPVRGELCAAFMFISDIWINLWVTAVCSGGIICLQFTLYFILKHWLKRRCPNIVLMMSIIILVDQILKCLHRLEKDEDLHRTLIYSPIQSIQLDINLLNFLSLKGMSVYRSSTELPLQRSTSNRHIKVYLHSHCFKTSWAPWFVRWQPGFRFWWHIFDSICTPVCVDLKSPSMNDLQCGTVTSHVCLCLYSCLMQLCKPMQVSSSCRFSWLLGRINPKNDFFIKSQIGLDEINIFLRQNAYLLNQNLLLERNLPVCCYF